MSLRELAQKWLSPRTSAPETVAESQELAAFNKKVGEVWLEYHNNELWARRKLEAGLVLTPEALNYMENENNARRLQKEADDRLKLEMEAEDEQARARGAHVGNERASLDRDEGVPSTETDSGGGASKGGDNSVRPAAPAEAGGDCGDSFDVA